MAVLVIFLTILLSTSATEIPQFPKDHIINATLSSLTPSTTGSEINSNSILIALLDSSHYTQLAELLEKALLLQILEGTVGVHNITIFAPHNEAIERDIDPEFKRFLLEPQNLPSLQTLILFHMLPIRIMSHEWPRSEKEPNLHKTLADHHIQLGYHKDTQKRKVDIASVIHPDAIVRSDGVIHGIEALLIPQPVQDEFNRGRCLSEITAVFPEGAPEVDPRTFQIKKKPSSLDKTAGVPKIPIYEAMAPGPSLAPAPAPGPGDAQRWFDGHKQVKDFIQTLVKYGGYTEVSDILVNLTSLATEMGRLVSEGYVLTILTPSDEAMSKLSATQLGEPGSVEKMMYYHMIPEYQTEESMYNAVRRFGRVNYDTLRFPYKLVAREAEGSVKFGQGETAAYLFDPDIYTDGRISVQGIDAVLLPAIAETVPSIEKKDSVPPVIDNKTQNTEIRRGKLVEAACGMLRILGMQTRFSACSYPASPSSK